jgi:psp operon transcriptional activator
MPESLIESELFGVERGAYTGASQRRAGRFESADGGTLFLDELGNLPPVAQQKLLRVVEYGSFERLGSSTPVQVDVRIIGATNVHLPDLADRGAFKRDLLDRLAFEVLTVPPLRRRVGDVLLLARHFAAKISVELGLSATPGFSEDVQAILKGYAWPGNVRELKNVVERAVAASRGETIEEIILDPFASEYLDELQAAHEMPGAEQDKKTCPEFLPLKSRLPVDLKSLLWETEEEHLTAALKHTGGHKGRAAKLLGLSYDQFRNLCRKHKDALEKLFTEN